MTNEKEIEKWRQILYPYITYVRVKLAKEEMEKKKKLAEAFKC